MPPAEHRCTILQPFSAIEATAPPARVYGRNETPAKDDP